MAHLIEARADVLTEFLEVAVHSILYVTGVYPSGIFKPRRKYNITVQMSCHEEVNEYIKKTLTTVHFLLLQSALEKVEVAIIDNDTGTRLESFIFTFDLPSSAQHKTQDIKKDVYLLEIEESLRASLLKISISDAMMKPHPPNIKFNIFVHTSNSAAANLEHLHLAEAFPWLRTSTSHEESERSNLVINPLKSVSTELIKMDIYLTSKKETSVVTTATEQK